jgi:transcriptional regulator with XRE-family HTH domain
MAHRKLNIIGGKLRELRMKRGYTLARLAAKCGVLGWDVSGGTLAKIETRQRSAYDSELFILKKALGVDAGDLFPERLDRVSLSECLHKPSRRIG